MALVSLRNVHWGFGGTSLLEGIDLQIESGERVCLVGRNGAGKSSLLNLIARRIQPDSGEILHRKGMRTGFMDQEVPRQIGGSVYDAVALGLKAGDDHHPRINGESFGSDLQPSHRVEMILSRTGLDPQQSFADLSAGLKRRTMFARALAADPDLLLLDEPTNHLDIEAIEWLEAFLLRYVPTLLFVTHDRRFLKTIATRIVELDRGHLISYDCDYDAYLNRREALLEAEARHRQALDKKLSQEEAWIRQGVKARRTRNQGRVQALEKLRSAVRRRRSLAGQVRMAVQETEVTGKIVVQVRDLCLAYGAIPVVKNLTTTIMRGDKIGIIGPNGAGKTTLLKLLLQQIEADSGTVRHGTNLQIAYYDQLRTQLDENRTVAQHIAPDNDWIVFNQQKRHVIGYLHDFLFEPQRSRSPVRILSGGERNRLMLAKLFTSPANMLVLDEPTNDLDVETLELLEELLFEYSGTVLLVSHDRAFLNQVVTSTLVFEGQGRIVEYAGGYDDWLAQRPPIEEPSTVQSSKPSKTARTAPSVRLGKLSYMQARELAELPGRIEALEAEQSRIHTAMSDPAFYKKPKEEIGALKMRLMELEQIIAGAYERWEALETEQESQARQ